MDNNQQLIPVFLPNYDKKEIEAVSQVLRSGWIGLGPQTEEFEKKFAHYVGAPYAIAVNSATAALHLALLAAGVGKGDEVIVPSLTFVSTAHAVLYVGAKPVFADIEPDTLCISPKDVVRKITKKTRAIIPVHYGGHPSDLTQLRNITSGTNVMIIEDAAHACGASYQGKKIGSISPFTCFSFHAVKNLATGDGGMITVKNKNTAEKLRRLRWVGINKETWDRLEEVTEKGTKSHKAYGWYYEVTDLGYKYHMNDINAAIGIVQLTKLDAGNKKRRQLAKNYTKQLTEVEGLECPKVKQDIVTAQHNYVIRTNRRDELHVFLRDYNISSGVHYLPVHLHPFYKQLYPDVHTPIAHKEWRRLLTLPLYPQLKKKQQDYIIETIKKFYSL